MPFVQYHPARQLWNEFPAGRLILVARCVIVAYFGL
jgi:hypothetical protein